MARAEEERTLAYDRARTTNPARARRSDRDALSAADRRVVEDDDDLRDEDTGRTAGAGQDRDGTTTRRVLTGNRAPEPVADNTVIENRVVGSGPSPQDEPAVADARRHRTTDGDVDGERSGHRSFRRRLHRNDR
jgi:hypothetical protein